MTPTQYDMPPSPSTMLLIEINTPPTKTATSRRSSVRAAAAATASLTLSRRGAAISPEDVRTSKQTRR